MIVRLPLESEAGASSNDSRRTAAKPLEIPITDSVYSVAWSPDGRQLLCGSRNGEAAVYDAQTGKRTGALVPHAREIVGVAWSPDGRVLLTADDVGMRLSDAGTLVTFDEVRPGWTITDVAVGPGGDLVAIAGWEPSAPPQRAGRLATLKLLDDSER
jgi:WD40 repeat protein